MTKWMWIMYTAAGFLPTGETVTMSYLDVWCAGKHGLWGTRQRRRALLDSKSFVCGCHRCEEEEGEERLEGEEEDAIVDAGLRAVESAEAEARIIGGREAWAAQGGARARMELEVCRRRAVAALGDSHWVVQRLLYARAEVRELAARSSVVNIIIAYVSDVNSWLYLLINWMAI